MTKTSVKKQDGTYELSCPFNLTWTTLRIMKNFLDAENGDRQNRKSKFKHLVRRMEKKLIKHVGKEE